MQVSAVFQKYVHFLKMYTPYINNYEKALEKVSQLKSDKKFNEVCHVLCMLDSPDVGPSRASNAL